jgi:SPP1 gp7 family putative phage head morphogenesis protein
MAYTSVMETYAERVERLVERKVLSRLPILGSGDTLDLEGGLLELEAELDSLAGKVGRSALAAGKRVSTHGRSEVGRMMKVKMPLPDLRTKAAIDAFAERNIELVRKAGRAQVARIRKAIAEHEEGDSLRRDITDALWVSRNRGKMIARDQAYKFHAQTIEEWSRAAGSEEYLWAAHKDERTRPGHARLDGTRHRYDNPPNTGRLEGFNRPGQAANCRCRMVPVEALY